MIDRTGPNISSRAIRISLRTPVNRVGRTNQPSSLALGQARAAGEQGRAFGLADAGYNDCTRSHCFRLTIGPISVAGSRGSPDPISFDRRLGRASNSASRAVRHEDAAAREAGLPAIAEAHAEREGDGLREIGIVEDDAWAICRQARA
jgi:hypothetical protein